MREPDGTPSLVQATGLARPAPASEVELTRLRLRRSLFLFMIAMAVAVLGGWPIQHSPGGLDAASGAERSADVASLHGRLWDFARRPIPSGYVFALGPDERTVLGCSPTSQPRGPTQGAWRIDRLPAGPVTLVGFDAEARLGIAVARVTLHAGEDKFFNTLTTEMSVPTLSPGGMQGSDTPGASWLRLLALLGTLAKETNRVEQDRLRAELTTRLEAQRCGSKAPHLSPPDAETRLVTSRSVGPVRLGMWSKEIRKLYGGRAREALVNLHDEGIGSQGIVITDDKGTLLFEVVFHPKQDRVGRMIVKSPLFTTKERIGVGSTVADASTHYGRHRIIQGFNGPLVVFPTLGNSIGFDTFDYENLRGSGTKSPTRQRISRIVVGWLTRSAAD